MAAVPVGRAGEAQVGFASLGLGSETLQAAGDLGFDIPTAVQEQAIPLLLQGRDVVAQAPTGTGKTARGHVKVRGGGQRKSAPSTV